jgi:hypothetical protein
MRETGPLDPPQYIGERLMTWEDLDALDGCSTDELCRKVADDEPVGETIVKPAQPLRLLFARLLAEQVAPEDQWEVKRILVTAIEGGRWPTWQYDFKIIRLALRGCGFVPGYPLTDRAKETFAESERRRANEARCNTTVTQ